MIHDTNNITIASGIDSLYYFIETNERYDELFLEIMDAYNDVRYTFERNERRYTNEDIHIEIQNMTFIFLGRAQGFYWFRDVQFLFKIGFKDRNTNKGLHNIHVQLTTQGIYTIGITGVIQCIDALLSEYITSCKYITRADINAFVTYDFSFVTKELFVTRKRRFSECAVIGTKQAMSTIYVGTKPFLLRLYDKKRELFTKKEKIELMDEYLRGHGINIHGIEPLWNVEFELHRAYLREFHITTVDELLTHATTLFRTCMTTIRLINPDTLTHEMVRAGHTNRAQTLPAWEQIREAYTYDAASQSPIPLERLKRKEYSYTEEKAIEEHVSLGRKAWLNGIKMGKAFYETVERKLLDGFKQKRFYKDELEKLKERFRDVTVSLPPHGEFIVRIDTVTKELWRPTPVASFARMDNYALFQEHERLVSQLLRCGIDSLEEKTALYKVVLSRQELLKRGLIEDEPIPF